MKDYIPHDPNTGNSITPTTPQLPTPPIVECPTPPVQDCNGPVIATEEHPCNITRALSSAADTATSPGAGAEGREGESEAPTTKTAESRTPCTAVGGALGVLCAILTALLVGVVMGWVWSCRKKARMKERHESQER